MFQNCNIHTNRIWPPCVYPLEIMVDKPVNKLHICYVPQLPALGEITSAAWNEKADIWTNSLNQENA